MRRIYALELGQFALFFSTHLELTSPSWSSTTGSQIEQHAISVPVVGTAAWQALPFDWVAAILASMRGLAAAREQRRLMKESMFSAARLSKRLSAHDEVQDAAQDAQPIYLRRKAAGGKAEFDIE